ncbi:hypothetical protein PILCRDRAFT_815580 [Piloderma croceum F 1598]|uniref:Uncharacterized protein n=1 Tax=Piloderma croceum (strain F 1598) TaxID=765440 RepID=A0A0C3FSF2_PILCF|nr:hypothetical protein PILCRDRAFT_815580 [Piloderma croceum F 1598]
MPGQLHTRFRVIHAFGTLPVTDHHRWSVASGYRPPGCLKLYKVVHVIFGPSSMGYFCRGEIVVHATCSAFLPVAVT